MWFFGAGRKTGLPYREMSEAEWARLSPQVKEALIKARGTPERPITAPEAPATAAEAPPVAPITPSQVAETPPPTPEVAPPTAPPAPEAAPPTIKAVKRTISLGRGIAPKEIKATLINGEYLIYSNNVGGGTDAYGRKATWSIRNDKTNELIKGGFETQKEALNNLLQSAPEAAPQAKEPWEMTTTEWFNTPMWGLKTKARGTIIGGLN